MLDIIEQVQGLDNDILQALVTIYVTITEERDDLLFKELFECECCGDIAIAFEHDSGSYSHEFQLSKTDGEVRLSGQFCCHGGCVLACFHDLSLDAFLFYAPGLCNELHEKFLND